MNRRSRGHATRRAARAIALVELVPRLHRDLPKTKTPHEQESILRQIAATDKPLDGLAYELYGLTEVEIRIVENANG